MSKTSEQKYAEAKRREKLLDYQFKEDLRYLLSQPQFRRFAVWLVYGLVGVNKAIWDPSAKIHYFEGRRSVGLDLLTTFTRFPELYSLFETERIQQEVDQLERQKLKLEKEREDSNVD